MVTKKRNKLRPFPKGFFAISGWGTGETLESMVDFQEVFYSEREAERAARGLIAIFENDVKEHGRLVLKPTAADKAAIRLLKKAAKNVTVVTYKAVKVRVIKPNRQKRRVRK